MPIHLSDTPSALVATIDSQHFDDEAMHNLVPAITDVLDRNPKPVILDISSLEFLPSLGIGTFVKLHSELNKRHLHLLIAGVRPGIRQVLAVTRLDRLFDLNDSLETALAKVHARASAE